MTGHWRQRPVSVGRATHKRARLGFLTGRRATMHLCIRSFVEGVHTLLIGRRRFTVHHQLTWWRQQLRNTRTVWCAERTPGMSGWPWPDASGHKKNALSELSRNDWTPHGAASGRFTCASDANFDCVLTWSVTVEDRRSIFERGHVTTIGEACRHWSDAGAASSHPHLHIRSAHSDPKSVSQRLYSFGDL
jgi:hypothetical protein